MITKELTNLGLSDYEARIYDILLQKSPAGASYLARKTNLSRSSVYTTLNTLIAKGLVSTSYQNEVKQFTAQGYSSMQSLLKNELETAQTKINLLSSLENKFQLLSKKDLHLPQIMMFEGKEGLKKIYMSMMRQSSPEDTMYILRDEFIWHKNWQFVFANDWKQRIKKIKKEKNLKTKLLVNNSPLEISQKDFYKKRKELKVRYLPEKSFASDFAIYIMNDIVSILSFENNNLIGIKITNVHLAQNFTKIFHQLWQDSK